MRFPLLPAAILLFVLFAGTVSGALPGDTNGNNHLERSELAAMILHSLESGTALEDARDAAYVYSFWDGNPKRITDSSGNVRVVWRPFHRVVVMNSETLETMRSIGYDTTRIVGVDKFTLNEKEFFPEFSETAGIGSIFAPDYEKIVSLRPDALFLYAEVSKSSCDEIEERLRQTSPGISVFRFDGYLPSTYPDEIRVLSELLDCQEKGEEFLLFYTRHVDTVTNRASAIPEDDRTRVYFETWNEYKTCSAGSGYDEKIRMAGGSNIFGRETAEYPVIDPESVLERSPHVIIKLVGSGSYAFGGYRGGNEDPFSDAFRALTSRKGWESLEAVRDKRTYLLHTDVLGGPQFFIGIQYMARWFYPDRFADLDPAFVHADYLSRFQGLDPGVANTHIFVYPR